MDVRRRLLNKKKQSSGGNTGTTGSYSVDLGGWRLSSSITNPDSTLYDGVYESNSNYNVDSGTATMTITLNDDCSSFTMYIRSYAESNYDYVMVGQLDKVITGNTSYSSSDVKAHTRGNQQSGNVLSSYTKVEFTGISSGTHTITVVYRKDGSANMNDDRGYVLIEKSASNVDGGNTDINNYLTIEALEDGLTASLSVNDIEYCVDGDGNWKTLSAGTATESINTGQTLSFKGSNLTTDSINGIGKFTITKRCNLKGNCNSLLFGDNAASNSSLSGYYLYLGLFRGCTTIINVSENFLPAKRVSPSCYYSMFSGCTNLVTAPALPSTTTAQNCYSSMFQGCTSLVTAPELPATTAANNCYSYMFHGCTSLVTAPELPATTITEGSYHSMFSGCTSLVNAPELPATIMKQYCYDSMFSGCTNLVTAPELPATTLYQQCYASMFSGCTSLVNAPELPATTLKNYCYYQMFQDCTSLVNAPVLPATTELSPDCYTRMFKNCSNLKYIKALYVGPVYAEHQEWVSGVASTGTFIKNPNFTNPTIGVNGIPSGWTVYNDGEEPDNSIDINNYLTIEALEDGLTASLAYNNVEYCVDGDGNWKTLTASTATKTINTGQTLSFRGNLTPNSTDGVGTFTINKRCNLKGNCMSLLFGDDAASNNSLSGKNYAFYNLFYNCSTIVNVSENFLPATTLIYQCYRNMFYGCTSLVTAPELPATTLVNYCYRNMFSGCTSLVNAPELPATIMKQYCYDSMFSGCTNLVTAPALPATTLAEDCYSNMFSCCTSLITAPELPATTLEQYCYISMFSGCTSLTTAPELPATTLVDWCYRGMFSGCTSLTTAPELPATTLAHTCYGGMFSGCTSLTTAPELPATTQTIYCYACYESMFQNCTSLTTAPKLPATTLLAARCYYSMFSGCTSLTTAPELPATTLASQCYTNMFSGCTSLVTAPELPATTLEYEGYISMFSGCTSLTTAPELPATTLVDWCYRGMFSGCTSLTTAPELPATTLADYCYHNMFRGCTSLVTAPALPATTLADYCYYNMFSDCTKLNYIKMLATDISATNCLNNWVNGVASTGIFIKHPDMTSLPTGVSGIPTGWTVYNNGEEPDFEDMYMTIEALEDGLTASLSVNDIEYCINGDNNWKTLTAGTTTETINTGQTLSFRGNLTPTTSNGIGTFTINKKCNLKGNCMSLLFGVNAASNSSLSGKYYAFKWLFSNCANIVNVNNNFLPATTLSTNCYCRMFEGCTSLTTAPELPATTIADTCYNYMFEGCTSLTTAPELPATALEIGCYTRMFQGCTSLTTAPELPATKLASTCYQGMFQGCTSLTTAPKLPATTLAGYCYGSMFQGCTSLTTAPELPATTLVSRCYEVMFRDCTNLKTAPTLPATTLADYCYRYMFYKCTNLTTAPELPATTLPNGCYFYMFSDCTKLNYIKMLATNISATDCLKNWVYNVASTGTFVKNPNMTSLPTGNNGIPSGWTVYNDGEESGGGNVIKPVLFPLYLTENTTTESARNLYENIIVWAGGNMNYSLPIGSEVYFNYNGQNELLTNFYYTNGSLEYIETAISVGYVVIHSDGTVTHWD